MGLVRIDVEDEDGARGAIILSMRQSAALSVDNSKDRTFLVALCRLKIDSLLSIRSPMVYGMPLDFAIAEATADLRKSMKGRCDQEDDEVS